MFWLSTAVFDRDRNNFSVELPVMEGLVPFCNKRLSRRRVLVEPTSSRKLSILSQGQMQQINWPQKCTLVQIRHKAPNHQFNSTRVSSVVTRIEFAPEKADGDMGGGRTCQFPRTLARVT